MKNRLLLLILIFLGITQMIDAQSVQLAPDPKYQFSDQNGNPLPGGKLCTYVTGTNTPQATYTDFTGMVQNANPTILDAAGRANVWWDSSKIYRAVLRTAGNTTTCADGVVQWTVDGISVSGVISIGNLPPLFTTTAVGTSVTFTLSNAPAHTLFGNFTGASGPPTYGAVGTDTQVTYNNTATMRGSAGLTWIEATHTLIITNLTNNGFTNIRGGSIGFAAGGVATTAPRISSEFGAFDFISAVGEDIQLGPSGNNQAFVLSGAAPGTLHLGISGNRAQLFLNDGSSGVGVFAGASIQVGVGDPEGSITAQIGSLWLRTDGGAMTTLYVKESNSGGNTGWVAK